MKNFPETPSTSSPAVWGDVIDLPEYGVGVDPRADVHHVAVVDIGIAGGTAIEEYLRIRARLDL